MIVTYDAGLYRLYKRSVNAANAKCSLYWSQRCCCNGNMLLTSLITCGHCLWTIFMWFVPMNVYAVAEVFAGIEFVRYVIFCLIRGTLCLNRWTKGNGDKHLKNPFPDHSATVRCW